MKRQNPIALVIVCAELLALAGVAALAGCAGRPTFLPPSDPGLRKSSAQFAADAAKRSYKSDAPRGGQAVARAQVGYWSNRLEIVNLSDRTWENIEVWVNHKYVVYVPKMIPNKLETLHFQMIFDDSGQSFPIDNSKVHIDSVEVYMDGKMFDVTTKLAD